MQMTSVFQLFLGGMFEVWTRLKPNQPTYLKVFESLAQLKTSGQSGSAWRRAVDLVPRQRHMSTLEQWMMG